MPPLSPGAWPVPIIALSISRMTARTSAKSSIDETFIDYQVGDAGDAEIAIAKASATVLLVERSPDAYNRR
jgi:hypothetical protein